MLQGRISAAYDTEPSQKARLTKSITKGVTAFADWRWETLSQVAQDLLRVQSVMTDEKLVHNLGGAKFRAVLRSLSTWKTAAFIQTAFKPIFEFSGWIRGCSCHEARRLEGASNRHSMAEAFRGSVLPESCPRSGLRAGKSSLRVTECLSELEKARDNVDVRENTLISVSSAQLMLSTSIALIKSKFSCVDDLPYFTGRRNLVNFLSVFSL